MLRPKFRWRTLAACAACAALALGAYPVYRAVNPPLHGYTVVEGGALTTLEGQKAPAGGQIEAPGQGAPDILPGGAYVGGDSGGDIDGTQIGIPVQDAPVYERAAEQYDRLLRGMGLDVEGSLNAYPDWFAGAWLDGGELVVAIVDGFRTPEREAEIAGWCGDGVALRDAKYSHSFLEDLMEGATRALDGAGLSCGLGVDVTANCLGIDLYSNGAAIPDSILAELAKLDPAGDAIRVRLFTGKLDTLTDELQKGPAPVAPDARATPALTRDGQPVPTPVDQSDQVYQGADAPADALPGGAQAVEDLPQSKDDAVAEDGVPAHYDLLPLDGDE